MPMSVSKSSVCARIWLLLGALTLLLFCTAASSHAQDKIITWGGNSPDWNKKLHVSAIRIGCSSTPQSCFSDARYEAGQQHVKSVFLSILLKSPQTLSDSFQYASLSASDPTVVEIGFDDFVDQAGKLGMDPRSLSSYLAQVAQALKQGKSRLKLGLTLYENEINTQLPQLGLNPDFSALVDYVHLYPHYRRTSEPFGNYVRQVKAIFPNAQVIAGAYAYDRRDYLPCAKGASDHCSNTEEISLFRDTFQQEFTLLRAGQVAWLEFYPGSFGEEASWRSWDYDRTCKQSRRQECLENTRAMRDQVLQILSGR